MGVSHIGKGNANGSLYARPVEGPYILYVCFMVLCLTASVMGIILWVLLFFVLYMYLFTYLFIFI